MSVKAAVILGLSIVLSAGLVGGAILIGPTITRQIKQQEDRQREGEELIRGAQELMNEMEER